MKLVPPNSFHLQAALGWLELDNHLEANEELEKIEPALRAEPEVLEVRWRIYARARKWDACVDLGETLVRLSPEEPNSWIHRSFALHELKRTREALDKLLPAYDVFPEQPIIPYNLACYECQLGNLKDAFDYLEQAFAVGDPKEVKLMALDDPDLEALWAEISEI